MGRALDVADRQVGLLFDGDRPRVHSTRRHLHRRAVALGAVGAHQGDRHHTRHIGSVAVLDGRLEVAGAVEVDDEAVGLLGTYSILLVVKGHPVVDF